jgi:hypothetical protein
MFEKKRYIQKKSLEKMHNSGKVSSLKISSGSQILEYKTWGESYYIAMVPEVWITIIHNNGDVEMISAKSLRTTYKVNSIFMNGERKY